MKQYRHLADFSGLHKRAEEGDEEDKKQKIDDAIIRSGTKGALPMSPVEMLSMGAGGALGGVAGWQLARMIHRKPSTLVKLLYALGGAAGGAGLSDMLWGLEASKGVSYKDRVRFDQLKAEYPEVQKTMESTYETLTDTPSSGKIVGGLAGGVGVPIFLNKLIQGAKKFAKSPKTEGVRRGASRLLHVWGGSQLTSDFNQQWVFQHPRSTRFKTLQQQAVTKPKGGGGFRNIITALAGGVGGTW